MKNIILSLITAIVLFSFIPNASSQAQGLSTDGESESGAVVCAPDVYLDDPGDCLPAGPSTYITDMAKLGLTVPAAFDPRIESRQRTDIASLFIFQAGSGFCTRLE